MASLQNSGRLLTGDSRAPDGPMLTPDAALASKTTTVANSRRSSVIDSTMDKDLEKNSAFPAGDAPAANVSDQDVPPDSEKKIEEARESNVAVSQGINPMDPSQFPEGGLEAWTVVFGAACGIYVSFGWINCIGVFQEYYQSHQLKEYTPQEIAWIPSLEGFMMFIGGLWVGRVYDNYGPRILLVVGTFLHVFGLMMASISHTYYQFLLSQGVCSPLGASMIFYPSMACVVTYFFRRRSLALGIAATGSSIGGVIFPVMVEKLIPQVGFGWTMRICAFMVLALMILGILTLKSRLPPMSKPIKPMDFVRPFMEPNFALLALGSFLTFLGLFLPFTFIILAARSRGVPENLAKYLVAILNAASTFGRTIPTFMADRFGRFTVFLSMSLLSTIIVLALWLPSSGTAATVVFTLVFGFSSGAVASILPALVATISPISQIGVRTGCNFSVVAIAVLVGSPIGGQLIEKDGYKGMQGFSGALLGAGCLVFVVLWTKLGGLKGKKV